MQKTKNSQNFMRLLLRGGTVLLGVSPKYAIVLISLNVINGLIDPLNAIVYQKLLDCVNDMLKKGSLQNTCLIMVFLLALLSITAFVLRRSTGAGKVYILRGISYGTEDNRSDQRL